MTIIVQINLFRLISDKTFFRLIYCILEAKTVIIVKVNIVGRLRWYNCFHLGSTVVHWPRISGFALKSYLLFDEFWKSKVYENYLRILLAIHYIRWLYIEMNEVKWVHNSELLKYFFFVILSNFRQNRAYFHTLLHRKLNTFLAE